MSYVTVENQYLNIAKDILDNGSFQNDRTNVGTYSIFGSILKCDTRLELPIITTKKINFNSIVAELLWFLKGSCDVNELRALTYGEDNRFNLEKKTIWDDNYNNQAKSLGYTDGNLGPIYGVQWRNFNLEGLDQVKELIKEAKKNPNSRRLLVSAWNPLQIDKMTLPPCHYGFQINIDGDFIDLSWNQRSCDLAVGIPYNLTSYFVLLSIFARILNKKTRYLVGHLGNVHVYKNHVENLKIQLDRIPIETKDTTIEMNDSLSILEDFENAKADDFILKNYNHHSFLSYAMAV